MHDGDKQIFEQRLASLWTSGSREVATAFLKRAIHPDMTLYELVQALSFEHARTHLGNIRLGDVLRRSQPVPAVEAAPAVPQRAPEVKERRKRRGAEEIEVLRELVLERLRTSMGSTTTSHLCEVLRNGGHEVDLLQMNRLLNQLEATGYVTCLGGKPKGWRLKPAGRTAPEPMQIRKASAQLPTPATLENIS